MLIALHCHATSFGESKGYGGLKNIMMKLKLKWHKWAKGAGRFW